MRLFTGIALPDDVRNSLSLLIERLRPIAQLRWSAPYNLHVTTKFIGEFPEERLPELTKVLSRLGSRSAIPIEVRGIGWLPNPHSPRVLFTGIRAGSELESLAGATEDAAATLGIPKENRAFRPHLTLARIKDSAGSLAHLRQAVASLDSTDFGSFTADRFVLYRSQTGPSGSIYTQLAEIPFTA